MIFYSGLRVDFKSYRFEKIRNLTFDESREGVGWGKDVDHLMLEI